MYTNQENRVFFWVNWQDSQIRQQLMLSKRDRKRLDAVKCTPQNQLAPRHRKRGWVAEITA